MAAAWLAGVILTGCSATGTDSQPAAVAAANKRCPIPVENVGFVNSITLSNDTLVYACMVTEPTVDLERLSLTPGALKRTMLPTIPSLFEGAPDLLEDLTANGRVLSVRYTDARGRRLNVDFNADEVDPSTTPTISAEQRLADEIEISRASLPTRLADAITIVDMVDRDGLVVFCCDVDETLQPDAMKGLRRALTQIRYSMSEALHAESDADIDAFVNITRNAGRGIAYFYKGTLTGDTATIAFSRSELER